MFPSAPAAPEESSFLHKGHREFSSAGESTPWLKKKKKKPLSVYFFCYLVCSHNLFFFCFPRSSGKYRFERKFPERQRQGMQKCMCNSNA